jgi:enoyl-CoA hydratase/carnithine racemase
MKFSFSTLNVKALPNQILIVELNRPDVMNAINSVMMRELRDLWLTLTEHAVLFRCVILTGAGDKAFCAGADLKERKSLAMDHWRQQHVVFEQAMLALLECPIPVIAAVNGYAFGGGLELTLAADFAYAASNAQFSQSETKIGLMPGAMGTQNLPKACGIRRAKELCFTAETFSAQLAMEYGVVNRVLAAADLLTETIKTATTIAENSPIAVSLSKMAINRSQYLDPATGFQFELQSYYRLLHSRDREEGIKAFNEKRKPQFIGE